MNKEIPKGLSVHGSLSSVNSIFKSSSLGQKSSPISKEGAYSVTSAPVMWYSPELTTESWLLPKSRQEILKWIRVFFNLDPYVQCLPGNTQIALLDGTTKTIEELYLENRKNIPLYSISPDGQIVAGSAKEVKLTRRNAQLLKVTLDNGESFECTPDHKIMMRDGSYIEAQNLKENDSLMPLYRRGEVLYKNSKYEQLYNPKTNSWEWTHRVILNFKNLVNKVIHHKNFNKFDNSPDNLVIMSYKEHAKLHAEALHNSSKLDWKKINKASHNRSDVRVTKNKVAILSWLDDTVRKNHTNALKKSESFKKSRVETSQILRKKWQDLTFREEQALKRLLKNTSEKIKIKAIERCQDPNYCSFIGEQVRKSYEQNPELRKSVGIIQQEVQSRPEVSKKKSSKMKQNWMNLEFRNKMKLSHQVINHKVLSVEILTERKDTYDLVSSEPYNNFALACGIFVHNSIIMMHAYYPFSKFDIVTPDKDVTQFYKEVSFNSNFDLFSFLLQASLSYEKFGECVTGDTLIPLLDGRTLSIKKLTSLKDFSNIYVYSLDSKKNIVPGKVINVWKKGNKSVLKITLDNGKSFRCTKDHPIMVRDGSYKEAKDLKVNDSIMPLYRNLSKKGKDDRLIVSIVEEGNEDVYDMEVEKYHNFALDAGVFVHNCIPFGNMYYDDSEKLYKWHKFILLEPELVDIKQEVYEDNPLFELIPTEELKMLVSSVDPLSVERQKRIPDVVKAAIQNGRNIPLDPESVSIVARITDPSAVRGTSAVQSLFKVLIFQDWIRLAQAAFAQRYIFPIEVWTIGDLDKKYIPTDSDLEYWRNMINQAIQQPPFTMVVPPLVKYEAMSTYGKVFPILEQYNYIQDQILVGLGVNKNLILGEGPSFSNLKAIALHKLIMTYKVKRDLFENWMIQKFYRPLAEKNNFYMNVRGKKRLILPQISWYKSLDMDEEEAEKKLYQDLHSKGYVSTKTLFSKFPNLDFYTEAQNLEKEKGTIYDKGDKRIPSEYKLTSSPPSSEELPFGEKFTFPETTPEVMKTPETTPEVVTPEIPAPSAPVVPGGAPTGV